MGNPLDKLRRLEELDTERLQLLGQLQFRVAGAIVAKVEAREGLPPRVILGQAGLSIDEGLLLADFLQGLAPEPAAEEEDITEEG